MSIYVPKPGTIPPQARVDIKSNYKMVTLFDKRITFFEGRGERRTNGKKRRQRKPLPGMSGATLPPAGCPAGLRDAGNGAWDRIDIMPPSARPARLFSRIAVTRFPIAEQSAQAVPVRPAAARPGLRAAPRRARQIRLRAPAPLLRGAAGPPRLYGAKPFDALNAKILLVFSQMVL